MSGPFQGGADPPSVQAVVVSYESRDSLPRCLESLAGCVEVPLEVTVVDNASSDGSAVLVRESHPRTQLLVNEENLGFAAACNRGWRPGRSPLVLFLNPDAELAAGALAALAGRLAARPDVGIVGPLTRNADGSVQVSTGSDLTPCSELRQGRLVRGVARRDPRSLAEAERLHAREHEPDWVSGACLLVRREALAAVGGFDEGFFLYEEDADLCRRVRAAGWRVLFTPAAEARHQLGHSAGRSPRRARIEYHRSHLRYYGKHNGRLARLTLRLSLLARGLLRLALLGR